MSADLLAGATTVRSGDTIVVAFRRSLDLAEVDDIRSRLADLIASGVRVAVLDGVESLVVVPAGPCPATMPARGLLSCSGIRQEHRCKLSADGHGDHTCRCGVAFAVTDRGAVTPPTRDG